MRFLRWIWHELWDHSWNVTRKNILEVPAHEVKAERVCSYCGCHQIQIYGHGIEWFNKDRAPTHIEDGKVVWYPLD